MSANCLGLEVLTGQMRLWSTFKPSPHLYRRWFMSSIYKCDLKRSMCVNKTRTAKVFMPSVTQWWFWNVHHHHLYLRQRWVNVLSLLDHQLCILQLILSLICPLRCAVPPGWPLRKRSAMILVEVSQQALFILSGLSLSLGHSPSAPAICEYIHCFLH